MKTIISFIISALLCGSMISSTAFADNSDFAYDAEYEEYIEKHAGTEVPELLDMYNTCCRLNATRLFYEYSADNYSVYSYEEKLNDDKAVISIDSASEINFDFQELYDIMEMRKEQCEISPVFSKQPAYQHINLIFSSNAHEENYKAAQKLTSYLSDIYKVSSSKITVNNVSFYGERKTVWTDMYTVDEFGYESTLYEELTEKQMKALNSEFAEKGYDVVINTSDGKLSLSSDMSEKQRLEFAVYLYETHGFYPKTYDVDLMPKMYSTSKTINLFYSKILGDVSNDNQLKVNDLIILNYWLLGEKGSAINNPQMADLNSDGRIDSFDLVLLRQLLVKK